VLAVEPETLGFFVQQQVPNRGADKTVDHTAWITRDDADYTGGGQGDRAGPEDIPDPGVHTQPRRLVSGPLDLETEAELMECAPELNAGDDVLEAVSHFLPGLPLPSG